MPDYSHPHYIPNVLPYSATNPAPEDGASSTDTATPAPSDTENQPVSPVSPETQRQAEKVAEEIVSLARIVEEMGETRGKLEAALKRGEVMADVLEGKALKQVPIIKHIPLVRSIPIPVDALVGLIPVVGDAITASAGLYIVIEAHRAGVPRKEIVKMISKIAIDSGLGSIPVVGDIFDFFYKSNNKNVEIFRKYVQEYIAKHEALKGQLRGKQDNAQARERFEDASKIPNVLG